jgi:hypothetical protein
MFPSALIEVGPAVTTLGPVSSASSLFLPELSVKSQPSTGSMPFIPSPLSGESLGNLVSKMTV